MEPRQFTDHYSTLGLQKGANSAQIRRAYRRMVLRYHPDRNPRQPEAPETFRKVTEAYRVLSDDKRRADYDAILKSYLSPPAAAKSVPKTTRSPEVPFRRRWYFESQVNPLDPKDARRGAALAALTFPVLVGQTNYAPESLGTISSVVVALILSVATSFGWRLGSALQGFFHGLGGFLLRVEEVGEFVGRAAPFFMAASAAALASLLLPTLGLPAIFVAGLAPAVVSSALAAWIGSALGRAFVWADPEHSRPWLGASVGVASAGFLAVMLAFLLTAATSDVLAGARFYSFWACSGGSAAMGGASAALAGALRSLDAIGQES